MITCFLMPYVENKEMKMKNLDNIINRELDSHRQWDIIGDEWKYHPHFPTEERLGWYTRLRRWR